MPSPAGHTPSPPLRRQFPPAPPGGREIEQASGAASAAALEGRGARQAHGSRLGRTEPSCPPGQSHAREPQLWAPGAGAANGAWARGGAEPRGPGQPEKKLEPGRDEKVTPPEGATRFVGKMLSYCVQDATVVDVEKRRSPSKHYVSTAPTNPGVGLARAGDGPSPLLTIKSQRVVTPGAALGASVCSQGCDL